MRAPVLCLAALAIGGGGPYAFPLEIRPTDSFDQVVVLTVASLQNGVLMDGGAQFPAACAP